MVEGTMVILRISLSSQILPSIKLSTLVILLFALTNVFHGVCWTQVENVECLEGDHIKFDFLGKDSIRYEVVVHPKVHQLVKKFCQQNSAKKREQPATHVLLVTAAVLGTLDVCMRHVQVLRVVLFQPWLCSAAGESWLMT